MWEPTVGQGVNVNVAHTFEGGAGNGWVLEELNAETEEDEEDEAAVADEDDAWLSELAELASISSPSPLVSYAFASGSRSLMSSRICSSAALPSFVSLDASWL